MIYIFITANKIIKIALNSPVIITILFAGETYFPFSGNSNKAKPTRHGNIHTKPKFHFQRNTETANSENPNLFFTEPIVCTGN